MDDKTTREEKLAKYLVGVEKAASWDDSKTEALAHEMDNVLVMPWVRARLELIEANAELREELERHKAIVRFIRARIEAWAKAQEKHNEVIITYPFHYSLGVIDGALLPESLSELVSGDNAK